MCIRPINWHITAQEKEWDILIAQSNGSTVQFFQRTLIRSPLPIVVVVVEGRQNFRKFPAPASLTMMKMMMMMTQKNLFRVPCCESLGLSNEKFYPPLIKMTLLVHTKLPFTEVFATYSSILWRYYWTPSSNPSKLSDDHHVQ